MDAVALSTVTLKWNLTDLVQGGQTATLIITPSAQMSDSTDHVLVAQPVPRRVVFSGGQGQLAGIVANDNSSILPTGTGYTIEVVTSTGAVVVPAFTTQLLTANGATQWLDQLAPVSAVTTGYLFLPLPSGTATAGYVPVATGSGEATSWQAQSGGGGGGAVSSVFGRTGAVVATSGDYTAAQVGADASGAAAAVLATSAQKSSNLSDLASATTARTNLGLGSAATLASTAVAQTANNLSDLGSSSTARTNLGLGTAATQNTSAFDASGAASTAQANAIAAIPAIDATATDIQPLGTQAAGASGQTADAKHVHPLVSGIQPSDINLMEWNYPAFIATTGSLPVAGKILLIRVPVRTARSVTNVCIVATVAGSGLTASQNYAALITAGGTVVGVTADQSTNWQATGFMSMALVGGPYNVSAGFAWVAVLANGTTLPTLLRQAAVSTAAANLGLGPSSAAFAQSGSGLTAMPASITPSANTLVQVSYWAALS